MKIAYTLAVIVAAAGIGYAEWRAGEEGKARIVLLGLLLLAAGLAIALIFFPDLPGPTQLILLLFGWLDKYIG